jgi:RHS repeat-associated protein
MVTDAFIIGSGFIKTEAIKTGIYMEPQTKKQVIAHCLSYLALSYTHKYDYDKFVIQCADSALRHAPGNTSALALKSNYYSACFEYTVNQVGRPPKDTLKVHYPRIYELLETRNNFYRKMDEMGYTEMPKEAYEAWLKSVNEEKERREHDARYNKAESTSRFLTIDPLAEKFPWLSPYVYCANNPLKYIDPDGKELIFIQDKIQYTYNNGYFWTSDGFKYTPEKGSTMDNVLTAYNKILESKDDVLINQFETISTSEQKHYIVERNSNQVIAWEKDISYTEQEQMVSEGKPVNTLTRYNFSQDNKDIFKREEGVENSNLSIVAHEMQHQFDYDQGRMKDATHTFPKANRPQEIRAVKNENRVRQIEGLPRRTTYGGVKIKF